MANVYPFDGACDDKWMLGNKGANLVTMARLGLPVPPGFVISVDSYREFKKTGQLPLKEIDAALAALEKRSGSKLGEGLAVSVRSSAAASMPGMMDTVLDVRQRDMMIDSVRKVFSSWDNARAEEYRRISNISAEMGLAVIIQAMVFGNRDMRSGTGVVFTRNPSNGDKGLFGEYLPRALGEDLVSGRATPGTIDALHSQMPDVFSQLDDLGRQLESHFKDMQDIEFTVESGKLYMLQTRSGKRSGAAAVKIAVDMAKEGLISRDDALLRITPEDLRAVIYAHVDSPERFRPIARGLNASPGAASGIVVFFPQEAAIRAKKNEDVILVRPETSPDDILGISAAKGVLTSKGGLTSHAAIVTRAMGKPSIIGAGELKIDLAREQFEAGGQIIKKGQVITVDGNTGYVYSGALPLVEGETTPEFEEVMQWSDGLRWIGVMGNADTAEDALMVKKFKADGIGLCRTERQFNSPDALAAIREFILAEKPEAVSRALARLKKLQKDDFTAIFKALQGLPIVIRLLDLPLHEFLPKATTESDLNLKERLERLIEVNPMMGHRGVRLAITTPDVYRMQVEAIIEALKEAPANVSIMVPQVITLQELLWVRKIAEGSGLKIGVMMETVRACMRAGKLAQVADFFSFGTNDLTQAVFSFSREDAEKKFLTTYLEKGILEDNPFQVLDVKGVGRLMETAIEWGRREKPDLVVGVCGEHAGEPRSIKSFYKIGVDYVSCSPFRIPVAKLVAAQASITERNARRARLDKSSAPQSVC
ncbi:MAG: putative PEP-binding protein [Dehalococcoidia bacterium]|nr:putative PEP-binding protein [Dehalococcoidia bacterium]